MNTVMKVVVGCSVLVAIGCGDDGGSQTPIDAPPSTFQVAGTITGTGPADGTAIVVWYVTSGSPDYPYKFGQGTSTPTTFSVSLASEPPPAALNAYGVGVGVVMVFPSGTSLPPDGIVDEVFADVFDDASISLEHSIIYKASNATPSRPWMEAMPQGYSCGVCVEGGGGTFDSFVQTACSNVVVQWGSTANSCNWT